MREERRRWRRIGAALLAGGMMLAGSSLSAAEKIQPETAAPTAAAEIPEPGEAAQVTLTIGRKTLIVPATAEEIDLGNLKLANTDADYAALTAFLDQLPALKRVDMFETEIRRQRLEPLAERYPQITFGWTMIVPCVNQAHPERCPHRIRTDITAYSTLHNNRCQRHTTEELSVLRYCRNLQALDIGHNDVDDISFLYDLPHLKVLIVALNPNLEDATPIGSLKELEYLEMFRNNIHDISCLTNCEHLVDLNLCYNRISDLSPLCEVKSLRRLWLYNSNNYTDSMPVPKSAVDQLAEALPDCVINTWSASTAGGWREHPRYDTINEMFWGTEYIPFTTLE